MDPLYLVVWTAEKAGSDILVDEWEACTSLTEAEDLYDDLRRADSTYIASICAVVRSTDYDPHPLLKALK